MKKKIKKLLIGLTLSITALVSGGLNQVIKASVGETIAQTFPDVNLAQVVAEHVANGDVNTILTQSMVDNLEALDASYKGIQDVTGIDVLLNLKTVDLNDNLLTSLPESLGNLSSLRGLNLDNNKLTSLPENFGNLTSLTSLHLENNKLTSLPESFGNLVNLHHLFSKYNQLTNLPESFDKLVNLNYLDLEHNQLTSLPESFGTLSNLSALYLEENQLTSLPENFGSLGKLNVLNLMGNQLTNLPESFGNLSNLGSLILAHNQLTSLPENFGNLTNLQYEALMYNLLPMDYQDTLNTLGLGFTINYTDQAQLMLKTGLNPYVITNGRDLSSIALSTMVELNDNRVMAPTHSFILENYVDENNNAVNINDYILSGVVLKEGNLFAQVRATGVGLFPNNSDHAVTVDTIALTFKKVATIEPSAGLVMPSVDPILPKTGEAANMTGVISLCLGVGCLFVGRRKRKI